MKRLQIQHLRGAGVSVEEVAIHTGVSPRTITRVSQEEPIGEPAEVEQSTRDRMGRPGKVQPFEEMVRSWLKAEPDLSGVAVLQRLRDEGYPGGKSAVYETVKALRPPNPPEGIVRFEGVAGEFSQHDFGEHVVEYEEGGSERIHFFASRLKFSRLMRVRLVADQTTETICHSLVEAFCYFGGMPLLAVFDNPRTIVIRRQGAKVTWQETFAQFSAECGFSPMVTWPYHPQEKGSVENLVGFVKSSLFKAHRFKNRADLEEKLAHWHRWANDERECRAIGETPRTRFMLEAPRLRPLRIDPRDYTLCYSRRVRTDGNVEFESRRFFAGYEHVGQTLVLRAAEKTVELWLSTKHVATHPRCPLNGKYSVLPEQREEIFRKKGARPYVKRQLLIDLCPAAEWYMTELRHKRPSHWEEEVERVFALLEVHGEERVRAVLIDAARAGTVGAEYLEAVLEGSARLEVRQ